MTIHAAAARTLQAYLVRRAVDEGDFPDHAGLRLADALDECAGAEVRAGTGTPGPSRLDGVDRDLCAFLGTILGRRGPDVHDYLSAAVAYGPQSLTGNHHVCGARLLTMRLTPRWLVAGGRDLQVCERCGFAANRSVDEASPESVVTVGGRTTVTVSAPGWAAGAVQPIGGHVEPRTAVRALGDGHHTVDLPLPPPSVPGVRRTAVAVVRSGDYQILQVPVGVCRTGGRG